MLTAAKSPSKTIAPLGWSPPVKVCVTEAGYSVWSAPPGPPAMSDGLPKSSARVFRAAVTDGSVHLIVCFASWSYLAGPAWER
ncbi:hypothetical protein STANM309S_02131 [Streptomyces tanashiensis]